MQWAEVASLPASRLTRRRWIREPWLRLRLKPGRWALAWTTCSHISRKLFTQSVYFLLLPLPSVHRKYWKLWNLSSISIIPTLHCVIAVRWNAIKVEGYGCLLCYIPAQKKSKVLRNRVKKKVLSAIIQNPANLNEALSSALLHDSVCIQ